MTPEAAFSRAWGRDPSPTEIERLRRLREAFSIDENDALLTIAMVLEFYDGVFRRYPAECGEAARDAVSTWLASKEGAAALRRSLGARGGQGLAVAGADDDGAAVRRELYWVVLGGVGMASSALSAALGMRVVLGLSGSHPCWVPRSAAGSLAVNLLGAPMGWLVAWALLVPATFAAMWGWKRGRDVTRSRRERAVGWSALFGIGVALVSWCFLLWELASARR